MKMGFMHIILDCIAFCVCHRRKRNAPGQQNKDNNKKKTHLIR